MADSPPGISAIPHDDNLRYFDVIVAGPDGSPFEGKHAMVEQAAIRPRLIVD